jgi:uncharacterized RDD family membrane protein YckC
MASPVQTDPTAVFGRRVLAAIIDAALILVPTIMLLTASFEYQAADELTINGEPVSAEEFCDDFLDRRGGFCVNAEDIDDRVYFNDDGTGASTALYWAATFGLLVLLQGFTGWTIGKLLVGIRCVREDGRPPGFVKALVRWVLWVVDAFPYFLPLVGFIVGLSTVGHRRVGDMAAKTFVVRRSAAGSPIVVPGLLSSPAAGEWGAPPPGPGGATTGWGPAVDPSSVAPTATTTATAPQWDEARGTYIQWDPVQSAWMQWDEATKAWSRVAGQ